MTIREEVNAGHARIRELQTEIDIERMRLQIARKRCRHPNQYLTKTVMGDDTWRCPDCS